MKERPILFSGPMVRAILAGRKTQTRRILKPNVAEWFEAARVKPELDPGEETRLSWCPCGVPGDRLWVRETWAGDDAINGWVIGFRRLP